MSATESLTIEIQGDSSGLSQALDDALAKVESLQTAAQSAAGSAEGIGGRLASVATAMQPLQLISQQLTRISQQAQALSQQPVSLNVQPALSALQLLMSEIQAVASQLSALSMLGGGPGRGPGGPDGGYGNSGGSGGATTRSATSVATSTALSNSSTSAGDSARTESLVRQPLLNLNLAPVQSSIAETTQLPIRDLIPVTRNNPSQATAADARGTTSTQSSFSSSLTNLDQPSSLDQSSSTVNHFGGITIEVRETADVNALMRDLRLQGLATRHRQG